MELAMYPYKQLYTEDDFQEDNTNYLSYDIVNDGLKDFQNYGKRRFSSPSNSVDSGQRSEKWITPESIWWERWQILQGQLEHVVHVHSPLHSPMSETFFKPFVEQAIEIV